MPGKSLACFCVLILFSACERRERITPTPTPAPPAARLAAPAGNTWPSDGTPQNIQTLHDSTNCKDGDTITLPNGTFHWTTGVNITKGITLKGNSTVAGDQYDAAGLTVTDNTVVVDDATLDQVNTLTFTPSQHFELTGISFSPGTGTGGNSNFWIRLNTATPYNNNVRIHHCSFNKLKRRIVGITGFNYGVIDHCQVILTPGDQLIYGTPTNNGPHEGWADFSWFGTEKFFFIEDNYIAVDGPTVRGITDCGGGSMRTVVRHNHIKNGGTGDHGTEGNNTRGQRAREWYDNVMDYSGNFTSSVIGPRGGNALAHDNKITSGSITNIGGIKCFRAFGGGNGEPWANADGSSAWDKNATEADGTFVEAHSITPGAFTFDSGTATSDDPNATGPTGKWIDANKTWTPNQWRGFSITNLDYSTMPNWKSNHGPHRGGFITANDAHSITFTRYASTDRGPVNAPITGNKYRIRKVLKAIDTAGSGKTDLVVVTGSPGVAKNSVTGVPSYLHMLQEPSITWNNVNTVSGAALGFNNDIPFVHVGDNSSPAGLDVYNLGKGFPADSTPQKVRDVLPASINGVAYNGTFAYPHPLVSGQPQPSPTAAPSATPAPTPTATANSHSYGHSDSHSDFHGHGDGDCNANCNRDCHSHADANIDRNPRAHADDNASSDDANGAEF
jgi:hypothetical protein